MRAEFQATGMVVRYGGADAVADAGFMARSGTITALVGPNGAGKSSLFQAIMGAVPATGEVTVAGTRIDRLDPTARVRAGIVLVPQGRQIFPRLTVHENLQVIADALGLSGPVVSEALDRFPILRTRMKLPAGVLSGGEQQMLALARALMAKPKVLLLDEPTLGLAPVIVAEVIRTVAALAESGMAVVIAEPSIRLIRGRIDRGYVMLRGRIVGEAEGAEALEQKYLGLMGMERREDIPGRGNG